MAVPSKLRWCCRLITDHALIERIAAGDQAALETLIYRYHAPVRGYLERLLSDRHKAEDLTQETFARLIRQAKRQQMPTEVRAWIYRVATNLCRDLWRSSAYQAEKLSRDQLPDRADDRPSVVEIFERQEARQQILKVLDSLSEVQRHIVILRFYQDLKLQEIADTLEMPLGSVKSSLFHALRHLKKKLLSDDEVAASLIDERRREPR